MVRRRGRGSTRPPPAWCAARESPPRAGTTCGSRRSRGGTAGRSTGQCRRARPGRVRRRAPGVVLVAPLVGPGGEVRVVVLPTGLEQVGMVRDQHRGDPAAAERAGDGVLPHLDRAPRPPREVEGADQDVVAGRHARERSGVVPGEADGVPCEPVDGRGGEFGAPVGAEQVPVEAVEQDHHQVVGPPRTAPAPAGPPVVGAPVVHGCLPGVASSAAPAVPADSSGHGDRTGDRVRRVARYCR